MSESLIWVLVGAALLLAIVAWYGFRRKVGPPLPENLRKGKPLPDFEALDEDPKTARNLGLLLPDGVPETYAAEYGKDTMWPATFVVDRDGIIRFAKLSRMIADRPDPKVLLRVLQRLEN